MQVSLIEVPYTAGDERHGASRGPQRLLEAGAAGLVAGRGIGVTTERVERGTPFGDTASASLAVNKALAALVRGAAAAGRLPVVLAGSCDSCLGVLAGFDHAGCGVVWVDAHADFNTPESTISGFFPGMSMAVITGHCYRNFWAQVGDSAPLDEAAILMLGVRDLSPAEERERLERSAIQVVSWRAGRPRADVRSAFDELATRVRDIYLHVDLDGLDPDVAPGIVDDPVPGGLSLEDLEEIIRQVGSRFRIKAAAVTTYNPDRDEDHKTARVGLRIIELLADYAGTVRTAMG